MNLIRSVSLLALASCALSAHAILLTFPDVTLAAGAAGSSATSSIVTTQGPLGDYGLLTFNLGAGSANLDDLIVTLKNVNGSTKFSPLPGATSSTGLYSAYVPTKFIGTNIVPYSITFESAVALRSDQSITNITFDVASFANVLPGPSAALPFALMAIKRRRAKRPA